MRNKNICSRCKTGEDSYLLDKNSPFCPYIAFYKDNKCSKFKKREKEKFIFLKKLFKK